MDFKSTSIGAKADDLRKLELFDGLHDVVERLSPAVEVGFYNAGDEIELYDTLTRKYYMYLIISGYVLVRCKMMIGCAHDNFLSWRSPDDGVLGEIVMFDIANRKFTSHPIVDGRGVVIIARSEIVRVLRINIEEFRRRLEDTKRLDVIRRNLGRYLAYKFVNDEYRLEVLQCRPYLIKNMIGEAAKAWYSAYGRRAIGGAEHVGPKDQVNVTARRLAATLTVLAHVRGCTDPITESDDGPTSCGCIDGVFAYHDLAGYIGADKGAVNNYIAKFVDTNVVKRHTMGKYFGIEILNWDILIGLARWNNADLNKRPRYIPRELVVTQ